MLNDVKDRVWAREAGRRLQSLASQAQGHAPALVDLSFNFQFRAALQLWPLRPIRIRPLQVPEEFQAVAEFLSRRGIRRVLEIGTSSGGTLFVWSWLTGSAGLSVSLDLPEGEFAGSQPLGNEGYARWRASLYRTFVPPGHTLALLKGDSHSEEMVDRVREAAGGEPFDFLFIDGDHSYEGVKRDFEAYSPLVKKGGHVGFHDIVVRSAHTKCEVERFWHEVKASYPSQEFIKHRDQGWGGIGLVTI